MGSQLFKLSVPGSLMLFGEHAVLSGKHALVCAINRRITVKLALRSDRKFTLNSAEFGSLTCSLDDFPINVPYQFVLAAIELKRAELVTGFDLDIESELTANHGLGSSAAVTVAVLAVLNTWLNGKRLDRMQLFRDAKSVVHKVQGMGSGADIAASIFGGVVAYQMDPITIERIADKLPLVVIYSGSKMPTVEVINKVESLRLNFPNIFSHLYAASDQCTIAAIEAIKNKDWFQVGELMDLHQGIQDAIGTSNSVLSQIIFALRKYSRVYGAKISGSGLGDCVIGMGDIPPNTFPEHALHNGLGIKQLEVVPSDKGLVFI